jgi:hypothetical protein
MFSSLRSAAKRRRATGLLARSPAPWRCLCPFALFLRVREVWAIDRRPWPLHLFRYRLLSRERNNRLSGRLVSWTYCVVRCPITPSPAAKSAMLHSARSMMRMGSSVSFSAEATVALLRMLLEHAGFYSVVAERDGTIIDSNFLDERSVIVGVGRSPLILPCRTRVSAVV